MSNLTSTVSKLVFADYKIITLVSICWNTLLIVNVGDSSLHSQDYTQVSDLKKCLTKCQI